MPDSSTDGMATASSSGRPQPRTLAQRKRAQTSAATAARLANAKARRGAPESSTEDGDASASASADDEVVAPSTAATDDDATSTPRAHKGKERAVEPDVREHTASADSSQFSSLGPLRRRVLCYTPEMPLPFSLEAKTVGASVDSASSEQPSSVAVATWLGSLPRGDFGNVSFKQWTASEDELKQARHGQGQLTISSASGERVYRRVACLQRKPDGSVHRVHRSGTLFVVKIVDLTQREGLELGTLMDEWLLLKRVKGVKTVVRMVDSAVIMTAGSKPRCAQIALVRGRSSSPLTAQILESGDGDLRQLAGHAERGLVDLYSVFAWSQQVRVMRLDAVTDHIGWPKRSSTVTRLASSIATSSRTT